MNIRFDGKTVAVTGAGHGFGRCIAQTFAHLGARVFATDLSADELSQTAAPGGIAVKAVDLRDRGAGGHWKRCPTRTGTSCSTSTSTPRSRCAGRPHPA